MRAELSARSLSGCLLFHCGASGTGGRGQNLQAPQMRFSFDFQYHCHLDIPIIAKEAEAPSGTVTSLQSQSKQEADLGGRLSASKALGFFLLLHTAFLGISQVSTNWIGVLAQCQTKFAC